MSSVQGQIVGTGVGSSLSATQSVNIGTLNISINADNAVGIKNVGGNENFYYDIWDFQGQNSNHSFGVVNSVLANYVIIGGQQTGQTVGSPTRIVLYSQTLASWYVIQTFLTGTGIAQALVTYHI